MTNFFFTLTLKLINNEDRMSFFEDVMEDLKEIDQNRIEGLRITLDQLKEWQVIQGS